MAPLAGFIVHTIDAEPARSVSYELVKQAEVDSA